MLRALLLTLFVLGSAGCFPKPIVVPSPEPGCLTELPPTLEAVPFLGPEEGCPAQFATCLDTTGGLSLERNVKALQRYAREAALRCYVGDGGL